MRRREFVWTVVGAALAPKALLGQQATNPAPPPPAPTPWMLGLNAKTPLPQTEAADAVADTDASFFSDDQIAALTRLSALLLPASGKRPGAVEVETPAFLDFLIGQSPAPRQRLYTGGLDWLNAQSKQKYGVVFAQTKPEQADALVKPWLRTWMTDHPPTEAHADFVNIAHADIRTATMNSKAWVDVEGDRNQDWVTSGMYWSPVEPDMFATNPNGVHVRPSPVGAPRSSHETQSYPR